MNRVAFKQGHLHLFSRHPGGSCRGAASSVISRRRRRRSRGISWLVFNCFLLLVIFLLTESSSGNRKSYTMMATSHVVGCGVYRRLVVSSSSPRVVVAATTTTGRTFFAFHHQHLARIHHSTRIRHPYCFLSKSQLQQQQQQHHQAPHFLNRCFHLSGIFAAKYSNNNNKRHPHGLLHASSSSSSSFYTTSSSSSSSPPELQKIATMSDTAADDDTIFALSSGLSLSGQATAVAVLRISGPQAVPILRQLLLLNDDPDENETNNNNNNNNKKKAAFPKPRVATLRTLYHPTTHQPLDQALILYFPGPKSFTGEDVVELHCHGSRAVTDSLLIVLGTMSNDDDSSSTTTTTSLVRYAEPGEFTQRAFASGKLDILQVEALADLLAADTSRQQQQALAQLDGQLSCIYAAWRQSLITALAHAEAIIDFGDDEHLGLATANDKNDEEYSHDGAVLQQAQDNVWGGVVTSMQILLQKMRAQLQDARRGELVRQGLQIAIVGPPNAGKSSLFNVLACQDVAIVSPMAGTTRDVLTVTLNLGGVKCLLQDTAGVRPTADSTSDLIEREGMKRAIQVAAKADVVVAVIDAFASSDSDTDDDNDENDDNHKQNADVIIQNLLDEVMLQNSTLEPENVLLVRNKADLRKSQHQQQQENGQLSSLLVGVERTFEISCQTQDGIDKFLDALTRKVVARVSTSSNTDWNSGENEGSSSLSSSLITRARHRQHVQAAVESLDRFVSLSAHGSMTVDLAAEELRLAASELGRITGAVDVEDILDKLFADFCIGK